MNVGDKYEIIVGGRRITFDRQVDLYVHEMPYAILTFKLGVPGSAGAVEATCSVFNTDIKSIAWDRDARSALLGAMRDASIMTKEAAFNLRRRADYLDLILADAAAVEKS